MIDKNWNSKPGKVLGYTFGLLLSPKRYSIESRQKKNDPFYVLCDAEAVFSHAFLCEHDHQNILSWCMCVRVLFECVCLSVYCVLDFVTWVYVECVVECVLDVCFVSVCNVCVFQYMLLCVSSKYVCLSVCMCYMWVLPWHACMWGPEDNLWWQSSNLSPCLRWGLLLTAALCHQGCWPLGRRVKSLKSRIKLGAGEKVLQLRVLATPAATSGTSHLPVHPFPREQVLSPYSVHTHTRKK